MQNVQAKVVYQGHRVKVIGSRSRSQGQHSVSVYHVLVLSALPLIESSNELINLLTYLIN